MGPSDLTSTVLKLTHGMQEFELKRQWSYYILQVVLIGHEMLPSVLKLLQFIQPPGGGTAIYGLYRYVPL